jgi:hypothetical protein
MWHEVLTCISRCIKKTQPDGGWRICRQCCGSVWRRQHWYKAPMSRQGTHYTDETTESNWVPRMLEWRDYQERSESFSCWWLLMIGRSSSQPLVWVNQSCAWSRELHLEKGTPHCHIVIHSLGKLFHRQTRDRTKRACPDWSHEWRKLEVPSCQMDDNLQPISPSSMWFLV